MGMAGEERKMDVEEREGEGEGRVMGCIPGAAQ